MKFLSLLGGCSIMVVAAALNAEAVAQVTDPVQKSSPPESPAGETADAGGVDRVIVTAQKREERLQDVPITVNVVDSTQLERQNITGISELSRAVPAIGNNGSVRGVSTNGFARSSEAAVSVVLDGVVLGRAAINNLFDIERVEVLSGPQGMLFGKNASAGVINIVTKAPDPTKFEAIGHIDYGNYDYQRERATFNVPLSDNAALRVGLHNETQGGWVRNTLTGDRNLQWSYGARARLLWEPTENLTINVIGDYDEGGSDANSPFTFAYAPTAALSARLAACGIVASPTNDENCSEGIAKKDAHAEAYGLSAQIDYTLPGDFLLTSITANRWRKQGDKAYIGRGGDTDVLNIDILSTNLTPSDVETFSQEVRLTSPQSDFVEYVAGLYYSDTTTYDQIFQAGTLGLLPPPLRIGRGGVVNVYQRSYAAFGQATIYATDQLRFIVGGRYTDEILKDSAVAYTPAEIAARGAIANPAFASTTVSGRAETDNFSWRLGAQYEWNSDLMTYVIAARGYKGPAVNDQASPPITQLIIRPEIPMNYEVGLKSTLLDGKLLATVALFHNKVKDFQTAVFVPPSALNALPGFAQGNAPSIVTQGIDVNVFGRPIPELTFNVGFIYNDATYSSDFLVACNQEQVAGVGACSALGTTAPVDQLANTPKWRALANGEYTFAVAPELEGFIQGDLVYETAYDFSATPNPKTRGEEHLFLGGRVGVRTNDGRFGLSLYGRNLLDNAYPTIVGDALTGFNGGAGRSYWTVPSLDWHRQYGLTLDVRY